MDLRRLRFGDWVMAIGGVAVLGVMFLDWFERGGASASAWKAFAVNDVILAVAALMALTAFVLAVVHPTAAVPLALSSLAAVVSLVALVLVALRLVWPPGLGGPEVLETGRATGAWLGLVATALLAGGCLASIRDERLPRPKRPVEPRLVKP